MLQLAPTVCLATQGEGKWICFSNIKWIYRYTNDFTNTQNVNQLYWHTKETQMYTICTPMSEERSGLVPGSWSGMEILAKVPPPAFFVRCPGLMQIHPSTLCKEWTNSEGCWHPICWGCSKNNLLFNTTSTSVLTVLSKPYNKEIQPEH